MAMNTSGAISLAGSTAGVSIAQQLGLGATTQISLNDSAVRTLAGVPSGAIVMPTNFYGKSSTVTINLTIASNTKNYNIFSNKGGSYVAGKSIINLTVNSGIVVGSASTSTYAMDTGSGWTSGDVINITNNGYIAGKGGTSGFSPTSTGGSGGVSMNLQWNIATFTNSSGYVYSGGGGGGQGKTCYSGSAGGTGGRGAGSSLAPSALGGAGLNKTHGGNGIAGQGGRIGGYGGAGGALAVAGGSGGNTGGDSAPAGGGGGGGGGASGGAGGAGSGPGFSSGGHGKAINLNGHTINGTSSLTRTYGGIS